MLPVAAVMTIQAVVRQTEASPINLRKAPIKPPHFNRHDLVVVEGGRSRLNGDAVALGGLADVDKYHATCF